MAVLPTKIVEIEFTAGVWTDVTADHVSVTTRRGRNRELGTFETGSGTLVLRNESRKYDPEYAAGAYYGKLRPNRRIRLRTTYSAVTYPWMIGYIDRITNTYQGPNGAVTTITFSDMFKILNRAELPDSVYRAVVNADAPAMWYHLEEAADATAVVNAGALGAPYNGAYIPTAGRVARASGLIVRDPGNGSGVTPSGQAFMFLPRALSISAIDFSFEFWLNASVIGNNLNLVLAERDASGNYPLEITIQSNRIVFIMRNTAGTAYGVRNTSNLATNTTYHFVVTHDTGRQMRIYVNGVEDWIADFGAPSVSTGTIIANNLYAFGADSAGGGTYTVDEFAIYQPFLAAAKVPTHNTAGRTPWNGDSVVTRAGRILDLVVVAAGDRSLDTGSTTLQSTSLGGTALAYLQKLADTELGELFITRDGKVRILGRREAQQGTYLTSQATLADATPAAGEVPYREGSPVFDVDHADVINRATVSRDGSIAIQYSDAASMTEFGPIDFAADGLLHNSDQYSADYAAWIVNGHKTPTTRPSAVAITPPIDPATIYPKLLALELGDRVTLKRRPKVGAAISADYRLESISHVTGPSQWETALELSPFNIAAGLPVFVWDVTKWDFHVWGI